jgi:hypothetical protein
MEYEARSTACLWDDVASVAERTAYPLSLVSYIVPFA